jgi:Bacteriophage tail tube protein
MNIKIQSLANAAIWLDGASLAGRAAKYDIPYPKKKFEDYKALGLASELELPSGLEKLESTIEWSSFDQAVIQAMVDYAVHSFQVRGNLEVHTSQGLTAQLPVVFLMNGMIKDSGKTEGEAQARVKNTTTIAIRYSQLAVAGVQIYEYDAFANIYVVGGVDQLSQFRANLGG